jgi:uncharacterized protein (DUF1697 family)
MTKYVAFLRGIGPTNPQMRNEKIKRVFEESGFKNVAALLLSGNILFESDSRKAEELETLIEKALNNKLGFTTTAIVRTQKQISDLIAREPFRGMTDSSKCKLNVTFLKKKQKLKLKFPIEPEGTSYKLIGEYNGAIFSSIDLSGSKTPQLMLFLEKQFGKQITTRTWNTTNKIFKAIFSS